MENENREKYTSETIQRVTWISLGSNVGLSIIKFILGYIGQSQAVIADAVHSLSDMTTDLAILFGVKFWSAPADKNHPYGHQRIETLITAFIGVVLLIVAIGIGREAVITIRDQHFTAPGWIAFFGAVLSIIIKEILYRWTIAIGRKVKSSALVANAWHHRTDAISSFPAAIAVAIAAIFPNLAFVDHIGAIIVAFIIFKVGLDIFSSALAGLSDVAASEQDQQQIKQIALAIPGVIDAHAIRTRKMGSYIYVDLHIWVDGEMTVRKGHDISEEVKQKLIDEGPDVMDVVVHLEPQEEDNSE